MTGLPQPVPMSSFGRNASVKTPEKRSGMSTMHGQLTFWAVALSALIGALGTASGADFGTWNGVSVRTLDTEHLDLITIAQARLYNDSSELRQYFISQQVVLDVTRHLRTGINYVFVPTRLSNSDSFIDQHRIEIDLTPRWSMGDRWAFDLRNRLEIGWVEGLAGTKQRMRNRFGASYELRNVKPLHSIFAHEEVFYRLDQLEVIQNRLVPFGLKFQLSQHVGFNTYYMLQSIKARGLWNNAHLIGTEFAFSF